MEVRQLSHDEVEWVSGRDFLDGECEVCHCEGHHGIECYLDRARQELKQRMELLENVACALAFELGMKGR